MTRPNASRRQLFGTSAALLLLTPFAAGPAKAAEIDGELLTLCADLIACRKQIDRFSHQGASEADWNAALDQWTELVEAIIDTRARTPEGIRQKAGAARLVLKANCMGGSGEVRIEGDTNEEDLLGWSLVHDILGEEPDWGTEEPGLPSGLTPSV